MLLALLFQFGGAPTFFNPDCTTGISELEVPFPTGLLTLRNSKFKIKFTFVVFFKKIRELIDGESGMRGLGVKGLDVFERPAELGEFGLILFGSEILFLVKIEPELIVAFSGAGIVGVGCED
jgi:hypothetical protein